MPQFLLECLSRYLLSRLSHPSNKIEKHKGRRKGKNKNKKNTETQGKGDTIRNKRVMLSFCSNVSLDMFQGAFHTNLLHMNTKNKKKNKKKPSKIKNKNNAGQQYKKCNTMIDQ